MKIEELECKISESSIVVASTEQVSSDVAGETVILNFKLGTYHGLNEVGTRVWNIIQQPTLVRHIQEKLIQDYEVESEICIQDLFILLNDLQNAGLLEVSDEAVS